MKKRKSTNELPLVYRLGNGTHVMYDHYLKIVSIYGMGAEAGSICIDRTEVPDLIQALEAWTMFSE